MAPPPGEHRSQAGSVLPCPYCRLYPLIDGKCQKCGTLCNRCGTPYLGAYCPRCWGEGSDDEEWAQGALGPVAPTPFGDSAPSRSGLSRIIDHAASVREHNIARGIHVDVIEKMVHDKASAAAEQLDVSREVRTKIMEEVEREAVALWRRARKGNERRLPLEKTVALAFLGQCRGIGRPVDEIQGALARAGFGIRMESVLVTVSSEDPSGIRVLVNGCERGAKVSTSPKTVRVPIYLSDLLAGGVVEIRVSGNGSIIDVSSPYESERPDWQTVRVNAGRRCFYLFKARKEATISTTEEVQRTTLETNVEALLKRFQPSKFPITATLMDNAGCLRKVEVKFVSLLREMIADAHGRAPESVAASALYLADMDTFRTLPPAEKSLAWSYIVRTGLAKGGYLGTKGLLLRSEVGYDESVVQKEDLRRIGGVVS
ncbi:MAG: hypothetical protein KGI38_03445 [Thaumarchaeota archaeon]|nr:hypothetical protein [Nitrososphaerota archaeon]